MTPYGTLKFINKDNLNNKNTENLGQINMPDLLSTNSDTQYAAAQTLDTFTRAINNLTTQSFNGVNVTYTFDIEEIIKEHEED